jgi:hypothetical protein
VDGGASDHNDRQGMRRIRTVDSAVIIGSRPDGCNYDPSHDGYSSCQFHACERAHIETWISGLDIDLLGFQSRPCVMAARMPRLLGKYIMGTSAHPIILFNPLPHRKTCEQTTEWSQCMDETLYHELGHAWLDSHGVEHHNEGLVEWAAREAASLKSAACFPHILGMTCDDG